MHLSLGQNVVKPIERQLHRLVDSWQISQPLHLRHLAIIRDTKLSERTGYYVHYTYDNFKSLVDSGRTSWEAVAAEESNCKKNKISIPPPEAQADLDEYGFPRISQAEFQGSGNDATLSSCVRATVTQPVLSNKVTATIASYNGNPSKRTKHNQADTAGRGTPEGVLPDGSTIRPDMTRKPKRQNTRKPGTFSKGMVDKVALPPNFKDMNLKARSDLRGSQIAAIRYAWQKAEEAIALQVENGGDRDAARTSVFAEIDASHESRGLKPPSEAMQAYNAGTYDVFRRKLEEHALGIMPLSSRPYLPSIHAHSPFLTPVPTPLPEPKPVRGRKRKAPNEKVNTSAAARDLPYLPSIHAHSQFLMHVPTPLPEPKPVRGRKRKAPNDEINESAAAEYLPYLPSIHAHSPFLTPVSTLDCVPKSVQGRKRKAPNDKPKENFAAQDLPSYAAPTLSFTDYQSSRQVTSKAIPSSIHNLSATQSVNHLPPPHQPSKLPHEQPPLDPAPSTRRRSRKSQLPSYLADSIVLSDNSTEIPAVVAMPKRKWDSSGLLPPNKKRGTYERRVSFYEGLSNPIPRTSTAGLWVSAQQRDSSRRGEPWGWLAIFRSNRLKDFPWFTPGSSLKPKDPISKNVRAQASSTSDGSQWTEKAYEVVDEPPVSGISKEQDASAPTAKAFSDAVLGDFRQPINITSIDLIEHGLPLDVSMINRADNGFLENSGNITTTRGAAMDQRTEEMQTYDVVATLDPASTFRPMETDGENVHPSETPEQVATLLASPTPEHRVQSLPDQSPEVPGAMQGYDAIENPLRVSDAPIENFLTGDGAMAERSRVSQPCLIRLGPATDNGAASGDQMQPTHLLTCGEDSPEDRNVPEVSTPSTADGTRLSESVTDNLPQLNMVEPKVNKVIRISKPSQKLTPHGGTMAILRKKIVMGMLEKCGGAMPIDRSLEIPFASEWRNHGHTGQPDTATIKAAVKGLAESGQLRQYTFAFRNTKGRTITKSMIVSSTLNMDDPKVQEVEAKIIAYDPYSYIPEVLIPPDDQRHAFIESVQTQKLRLHSEGQKGSMATAELPRKPLYQIRYENRKKAAEERAQRMLMEGIDYQKDLGGRRQQAQGKAESKQVKKKSDEVRNKYKDKHMTAAEQQNIVEEHDALLLSSMSSTGLLAGLPKPPSVVESRTSDEFASLSLPDPSRVRPYAIASRRLRRLVQGPGAKHPGPKIGRLASLNDPVPKPSLKNVDLPSDVGALDVFRLPREPQGPAKNEPAQANQNAKRHSASIEEETKITADEQCLIVDPPIQPPWEILQLNTINPDSATNFHGLRGLLSSDEEDTFDEFRRDINDLLRWELEYVEHEYKFGSAPFVNHTILHKHKQADNPIVDMDDALETSWDSTLGRRCVTKRLFPYLHLQPGPASQIADAGEETGRESSPSRSPSPGRSVSPEPQRESESEAEVEIEVQPFEMVGLFHAPVDNTPLQARFGMMGMLKQQRVRPGIIAQRKSRKRRVSQLAERSSTGLASTSLQDDLQEGQSPRKKIMIRGPRKLRNMTQDDERRLLVAVIVVRTIAGGLESHIDWKLVARIFEPEFDEMFIHKVWGTIRNKHRLQYERILSEFQDAFPTAYEQGEVAPLDFEHLEDYPWRQLIDWTLDLADFPIQSCFELPAQRSGIDELFSLKAASDVTIATFFNPDTSNTMPRRQAILNRQAYAYPIMKPANHLPFVEEDSKGFYIAKTWVRANTATPAETYNPEAAKEKLSIFRPEIIERAVRDLLGNRVISGQRENRRIPGRNYDLSESCLSCLEKSPSVSTLRAAIKFKTWLDEQFQENGSVDIPTIATDAQALVLTSLFAHRRVKLRPKDPPMKKFGLLPNNSYETRHMDKRVLNFSISIFPTGEYVLSIPIVPASHPPPAPHLSAPQPAAIPFWYDINGAVIPVLWELALAAVLATVSSRPGIALAELERAVKPVMGAWEVKLMLEWGIDVGIMEIAGCGWVVREWWWGIFGEGQDSVPVTAGNCSGQGIEVNSQTPGGENLGQVEA